MKKWIFWMILSIFGPGNFFHGTNILALGVLENFNFLRFFKISQILKNLKKLEFSRAPRAQNICPMKKISGVKNAQNHPKNLFFMLRSW
jgi:hypothetical protein